MASSRPLRRLAAALCALAIGLVVEGSPAGASGVVMAPSTGGERGSGPPIVLPRIPRQTVQRTWSDVPDDHWARKAIDFVAATNDWMFDFKKQAEDGAFMFRPDAFESRRLFARAVVRAFAPDEPVDPQLTFADLPEADRFFNSANVAVELGWMTTDADGNFLPGALVTTRTVHRALVRALGLSADAEGLDAIHMKNGTQFETPRDFGTLVLGMLLGLRYNHSDESLDVGPDSPLPRSEVAWSLFRATTTEQWQIDSLAPYATIELPNLGPKTTELVQFAIGYVGYPYVYGGEWDGPAPEGYCCGVQPVGGFDCSGFTWWIEKAAENGWDNVPPRDYVGWPLPQRTSAEMSRAGTKIREFEDLKAGDLMFYDGDGDGVIDHVDVYIGNGWSVDSGSSDAGVSIVNVASGWYFDHFVRGRRLIGV
jgi:cell wall-associated NlpC family hydrolase